MFAQDCGGCKRDGRETGIGNEESKKNEKSAVEDGLWNGPDRHAGAGMCRVRAAAVAEVLASGSTKANPRAVTAADVEGFLARLLPRGRDDKGVVARGSGSLLSGSLLDTSVQSSLRLQLMFGLRPCGFAKGSMFEK